MVEMKFTFSSVAEASAFVSRAFGLTGQGELLNSGATIVLPETASAEAAVPAVVTAADASADAAKRTRRTKAEIEAAKAAETAASLTTADAGAAQTQAAPASEDTTASSATSVTTASPTETAAETPAPSAEQVETKRREVARPALQSVIQASDNDTARKFIEDFGYAGVKFLPYERIDEFVAKCHEYTVALKAKKAA